MAHGAEVDLFVLETLRGDARGATRVAIGWLYRMVGSDGGIGWWDRMVGSDGGIGWWDRMVGSDGGIGRGTGGIGGAIRGEGGIGWVS